MKVCHTSEIFTFQKTLILQLQVMLELSQFQEILSTYTDFLFLFAEYPSLFKFFKNEPIPLMGKNKLLKNNFITQDPARDGSNWYGYCGQNPLSFIDTTGLFYYTENGQKSSSAHKNTQVYIFRSSDGTGNKFDSTRIILKEGKCVFVDSVGSNCSEKYYDGKKNFTKPDGVYYYSFENLTSNGDGTYDSKTYHNVIRTKTDDKNISEEKRNAINNNPGDFLDHANQFKDASNPYNSNETPGGAGCDICKDGQAHQDEYMRILMDGVDRPEEIRKEIISVNNITTEEQ